MQPDPFLHYTACALSLLTLAFIVICGAAGLLPLGYAALLFLILLSAFGAYLFLE